MWISIHDGKLNTGNYYILTKYNIKTIQCKCKAAQIIKSICKIDWRLTANNINVFIHIFIAWQIIANAEKFINE